MRIFKAGLIYFALVFSAGFVLALIRIPLLVPRFGVRAAELMQMTVMLAVIFWASQRLVKNHLELLRSGRLAAGVIACVLLISAEFALAYFFYGRSPGEYITSRDSVSGTAYLISLFFFALAPALWTDRLHPVHLFKPSPHRGDGERIGD